MSTFYDYGIYDPKMGNPADVLARLNVPLIRDIQHHIRGEILRFHMGFWGLPSDSTPCGITACIGGWGYILAGSSPQARASRTGHLFRMLDRVYQSGDLTVADLQRRFAAELGLDMSREPGLVDSVFHAESWPEPFRTEHREDRWKGNRAGMVEAACRRLDHLIETGT